MFSPADVHERLAWVRAKRFGRRGQAAFARALGIAPTTYAHYEKDICPPMQLAAKMVAAARVNPRWLWHGIGSPFLPEGLQIPTAADPASLIGALLDQITPPSDRAGESATACFPRPTKIDWQAYLRAGGYPRTEVVRVKDEAMSPWVPRHSVVGIDCSANTPEHYPPGSNMLVAMKEKGEGVVIRLLSESEGAFAFSCWNRRARPNVRLWSAKSREPCPIVGRVVFVFKQYGKPT